MSSRQTQFLSGAILENPAKLLKGSSIRVVIESASERRVVQGLVVEVGADRIDVRFEAPVKVTGVPKVYQEGFEPVDPKAPEPSGRKPLPSAHQIGDKVILMETINAIVTAVHFGEIKVHYDLKVTSYGDMPLRDVSSDFIEDA